MGLQGRLAMGGEALNPNAVNVAVAKDALGRQDDATFALMHKASLRERDAFWAGQHETSYDARLSSWKTSLVESINDRSSYFGSNEKGQKQAGFFAKIGIDTKRFTDSSAQAVYDKYCAGDTPEANISRFARDVVASCRKPDGTVDMTAVHDALPAARWLANIFGGESAELLTQMIDAEVGRETHADAFVARASEKVNDLSDHEKKLLSFLTEIPIDPTKAVPTPEPDTHPEPPQEPDFVIHFIDRPKEPSELITILDQEQDKPIIIRSGDLPPQTEFTIDLRPSLEVMGKKDVFERSKQIDGNTTVTDLIPLPGQPTDEYSYFYFNVAQNLPDGNIRTSGNIIARDQTGTLVPVGHADFTRKDKTEKEASCCMGVLDQIRDAATTPLPDYLQATVDYFNPPGRGEVAVHVDDRFRGKKMGETLWFLSLAQAEMDGIESVGIHGDLTQGQRADKPEQSFYVHLGAIPTLYMTRHIDFIAGTDQEDLSEKLVAPTYGLTEKQKERLKKLLG